MPGKPSEGRWRKNKPRNIHTVVAIKQKITDNPNIADDAYVTNARWMSSALRYRQKSDSDLCAMTSCMWCSGRDRTGDSRSVVAIGVGGARAWHKGALESIYWRSLGWWTVLCFHCSLGDKDPMFLSKLRVELGLGVQQSAGPTCTRSILHP